MIGYIKNFFYLIFILTFIIFFFFSSDKDNNLIENETLKSNNILKEKNLNIIENINYSSFDKEGNKYLIEAKSGEVMQSNFDKIQMKNVYARITFLNYDFIEIKSNYAKYDKETSETLFYGNVLSSYSDHLISSNELKLLFDKKLAKIKDNVVYKSNDGRLEADEVLLNLYDKKAKISMNDSEEMVKISYLN